MPVVDDRDIRDNRFVGFLRERIAIDLGTAYSIVAHESTPQMWRLPSSVAIDRDSGKPIAFGERAKKMFERGNSSIQVIRPLKDGVISNFEAAGHYLSHIVSQTRRNPLALHYTIFVCVPWGATSVEVKSYINRLKTFRQVVKIVREPFAAALGCGLDIQAPKPVTVVDLGGGTVEMSTMAHGCMIHCSSAREAGHAMDQLIVEKLLRHRQFEVGLNTAEEMKIHYGSVTALEAEEEFEVKGVDRRTQLPSRLLMTTQELRFYIEPMLTAIERNLQSHLRHLPAEPRRIAETEGLWMVGGGALLTGWKERLEANLSLPVLVPDEPQYTVIRGLKIIIDRPRRFRGILKISENTF